MALNANFRTDLESQIAKLKADRVYKTLNHLESPQAAHVRMEGRGNVLVLSSNNYLGLANHPKVKEAAIAAIERWGVGAGAVRWIGGTTPGHCELFAGAFVLLAREELRDPFEGQLDLKRGLIRAVGVPADGHLAQVVRAASRRGMRREPFERLPDGREFRVKAHRRASRHRPRGAGAPRAGWGWLAAEGRPGRCGPSQHPSGRRSHTDIVWLSSTCTRLSPSCR